MVFSYKKKHVFDKQRAFDKKNPSAYCNELLTKHNEPVRIDMMGHDAVAAAGEGDAFVNTISRGGLIKPSELLYSMHSCFVSSEKTKNS